MESAQLKQDITSRHQMLVRLQYETDVCETERSRAEAVNKKQRRNLSMYKVQQLCIVVLFYPDMRLEVGFALLFY